MTDREKKLEAELIRLRKAIEPFANVANWADRCSEEDRLAKLDRVTIHISTYAFSSSFVLQADDFYKARRALNH